MVVKFFEKQCGMANILTKLQILTKIVSAIDTRTIIVCNWNTRTNTNLAAELELIIPVLDKH